MATQTSKPASNPQSAQPTTPDVPETSFGITDEVKGKNRVPFQPTEEHPITLGYLIKVESLIRKLKESNEEKPVLVFEFIDAENLRTYTHVEWAINSTEEKYAVRLEGLQARIKHIYEEFGVSGVGLGAGTKSFKDFFDAVATAFNTNGKDGGPIYTKVPVWLKTTYSLKGSNPSKAQLSFPLYPNFIEKYIQGRKTTLYINKNAETIVQPVKAKSSALPGGGDAFPAQGAEFPDFPQFPAQ